MGKQQRRSNWHYVILSETWDTVSAQWESTKEVHAHACLCSYYEHICALYVQISCTYGARISVYMNACTCMDKLACKCTFILCKVKKAKKKMKLLPKWGTRLLTNFMLKKERFRTQVSSLLQKKPELTGK